MDINAWIGGTIPTATQRTAKAQQRAADAYWRLNDKFQPVTSVAFKNASGTVLAAQTVRVEVDNRATLASSVAGAAPRMALIVYGVRNHPTLADTDIKEGYRFVLNGDEYRCVDIILNPGEIQGVFVATG